MYGKEDEREVLTRIDVINLLNRDIRYDILAAFVISLWNVLMLFGWILSLITIFLIDEYVVIKISTLLLMTVLFLYFLRWSVKYWNVALKKKAMLREGYCRIYEDIVVRVGPSYHVGRRKWIYPVYLKESGKAIYNTRRWFKYLSEGSSCIVIAYDETYYKFDECNIIAIYPSEMYRYVD